MKKILLISLVISLLVGCKTEFEKIRTSGDAPLLFKKANEYFDNGQYQKALSFYELIIPSYRGSKELEKIQFNYAKCEFNLRNYILAAYNFNLFSSTFPNSELREESEYMAAFCNYKMSPGYRLDQESTAKAIEGFEQFVTQFPESSRVKECNNQIDFLRKKLEAKIFEEGQLYYNLKRYQSAITVFDNLLKDYPETKDAEQVRFMILKSTYEYAINSIEEKQKLRFEIVLEKYQDFIAKFPNSKLKKDALVYYKNSQKKLKNT
jgi:outer membrane protein assembly factor BamD